ncbi:DUF4442 domain-containing protein [Reichenbachiella agariperforans]|nr:DUF4442 domain-containing protein [Reichenbachiella agariperforans]
MFNLSPMYRRSTGRITTVSDDLLRVDIKIPLSYKNKNYVGTMFGGSLFSATDPIYMIQLMQILGNDYVVWDKASTIRFKRPVTRDAYAVFSFSQEEITAMKQAVLDHGETDIVKLLLITDKKEMVFSEVEKTIYVASKSYYKEKRNRKRDLQR